MRRGFQFQKRGVAIHLILALLISTTIITLTWYFATSKASTKPSFLLKLKADYQMESAIILNFHRLKTVESKFSQNSDKWNPRQEIAPGIFLKSGCRKADANAYKILTYVEGPGFSKFLSARALKEEFSPATASSPEASQDATPSTSLENPPAPGEMAVASYQWRLEFLPNQGEKL